MPFDSDRKCMTTVHQYNEKFLILVKGAPEAIAKTIANEISKNEMLSLSNKWAEEGFRVLAFGYKLLDKLPAPFNYKTIESDILWSGLCGITDPHRV